MTDLSDDNLAMIVRAIELTEAERDLLGLIKLEASLLTDHNDALRNGDLVQEITLSLLDRNAIPESRMRYFLDPEYNVSGRGVSHKDVFEKNRTRGNEIFRHPHFLPYLSYFLFGASLHEAVIEGFCDEVSDCGMVTSGDIIPLGKYARAKTRALRLEPGVAAEEFYKLALDCGLGQSYARSIRDAVKRLR